MRLLEKLSVKNVKLKNVTVQLIKLKQNVEIFKKLELMLLGISKILK